MPYKKRCWPPCNRHRVSEGKAGVRIGILKHKIADHWRHSAREAPVPEFTRTAGVLADQGDVYVWASNTAKGSVWPNAFAGDHAMMLALRGPGTPLNVWYSEKRNIRADLQKLFGEDFRYIDAVALMTDTDNSSQQVSAFYGDIWFSKD